MAGFKPTYYTSSMYSFGQNVVCSMHTKAKSAVCQKILDVNHKNSPVCIGPVYIAYYVPHCIEPEQSQQPFKPKTKRLQFFVCYFIIKFTSEKFLGKKSTV